MAVYQPMIPNQGIGALQQITNPGYGVPNPVTGLTASAPKALPQQRIVATSTRAAQALQQPRLAQPVVNPMLGQPPQLATPVATPRLDQLRQTFMPQPAVGAQINPLNPLAATGGVKPGGASQSPYGSLSQVPAFQVSQMSYFPPTQSHGYSYPQLGKLYTGPLGPAFQTAQQLAAQAARNK